MFRRLRRGVKYSMRLLMGQIGEGVRWTAGILPGWETRRGQAGRLRYVLPRLGLQVSSMAERGISLHAAIINQSGSFIAPAATSFSMKSSGWLGESTM